MGHTVAGFEISMHLTLTVDELQSARYIVHDTTERKASERLRMMVSTEKHVECDTFWESRSNEPIQVKDTKLHIDVIKLPSTEPIVREYCDDISMLLVVKELVDDPDLVFNRTFIPGS